MTSTPTNASAPGTRRDSGVFEHGTPHYKPRSTHRLDGPALPPNGSPEPSIGLERLNERLERLAFGGRPEGHNAPPLETYTATPSEHGDVVCATEEYVRWFRRTYSVTGPEDRVSKPSPRPSSEGVGGAESTKGRWKQNDLAP